MICTTWWTIINDTGAIILEHLPPWHQARNTCLFLFWSITLVLISTVFSFIDWSTGRLQSLIPTVCKKVNPESRSCLLSLVSRAGVWLTPAAVKHSSCSNQPPSPPQLPKQARFIRMRHRGERCGAWQLSLIWIRFDSPADLARCPRVCVCQVGALVTPASYTSGCVQLL